MAQDLKLKSVAVGGTKLAEGDGFLAGRSGFQGSEYYYQIPNLFLVPYFASLGFLARVPLLEVPGFLGFEVEIQCRFWSRGPDLCGCLRAGLEGDSDSKPTTSMWVVVKIMVPFWVP